MTNVANTINYIELPLVDVAATKAFYGTVFGWTFTDWGPDYISFCGAGIDGGFNAATSPAADTTDQAPSGVLVVLYATDLEQTLAAVSRAGATIVTPIYEFPGGRRFHFSDPNANQLAVWSP